MLEQIIAFIESSITQGSPKMVSIFGFILLGITVFLFIRMVKWWNRSRMIADVPTSKIRSASQGYVELTGAAKMMDGTPIISPLSGKACVWFRYKIEEKITESNAKGSSSSAWRVIEEETSDQLFLLEDETGRCIIDPDDADVIASNKRTWRKDTSGTPRRYTEELIREHEPLYTIGLFNTLAHEALHEQQQDVNYLLREWKQDYTGLLNRFDDNGNGQLDSNEWEQARIAAEQQIKREYHHKERLEQLSILKNSAHKHQGFIIATIPEEALINYYKKHAFLAMLAFFATGSFLVWAINIRLGQ